MILETEYLKLRLAHFYCRLSLEITLTVPLSYVLIKIFFCGVCFNFCNFKIWSEDIDESPLISLNCGIEKPTGILWGRKSGFL